MTLTELLEKKKAAKARIDELLKLAETEGRELNETEQAEYDALVAELSELEKQVAEKEQELRNFRVNAPQIERFSLLSAIKAHVEHRSFSDFETQVINAGRQEMQRANLSYNGSIVIPMNYRASIQATVAGAGIENIETEKLDIIGKLRNKLVLVQAGAQYLTNLVGNVSIPVYSGSNVAWAAETGAAVDAGGTFTQVNYAPKRLTANLKISKQFLLQDNSGSAESLLQADLVAALQEKLETTFLGATAGSATTPAGLGAGASPATIAAYADIVNVEADLEALNVHNLTYVLSPSMKAALRSMPKEAGQALFVYDDKGEIAGNKALSTSSVPADSGYVGDWSDFIVAQWGALDMLVDPYTLADSGLIRIIVNSYWDGKPRRAASFKVIEL
jgi:HK97 family phage major capsid protein